MHDQPQQNQTLPSTDDRDRLKALYDAAPYPAVLANQMVTNTPLLPHWINSVVAPDGLALHPNAHILVAGCGSGREALMLAQQFPFAQILGVDFSTTSIERAQQQAVAANLPNVQFKVADLTYSTWSEQYAAFDFILCHGVADYVLDVNAFLQTLAQCLAPNGVLCMTANSPHHPAGRIRTAFQTLGISPEDFQDHPNQRQLLQIIAQVMGNDAGIQGLGNAPQAYLNVDIFAPIAHHHSIDQWCQYAKEAGLHFGGSLDALLGLTQLSNAQLPLLYTMGKSELSLWMARLNHRPGMQLLFSLCPPSRPSFNHLEALLDWTPKLDASIGQLPPLTEQPEQARPMTLRFQDLPDFVIHSSAYDLEVLRHCDGKKTLRKIINSIPFDGNLENLRASLFKAFHFGILAG